MSTIKPGEVWLPGRSREAARLLLQAASNLDLDASVVRGLNGGYGVPEEVKAEAKRIVEADEFDVDAKVTEAWAPTDVATDTDDSDVSRVASGSKGGVSYVVSGGPKKPAPRGGTKTVTPEQLEADRAAARAKADEAKAEEDRLAAEKAAAEEPPAPLTAEEAAAAGVAEGTPVVSRETIVAETVEPGTEVTEENTGAVVDESGTVHEGEIPAEAAAEKPADESAPVEEPAKNASKVDWIDFARTRPNWDETDADENDGLSRNELAAKYGTPTA
jgi:hypothetical protein